MCNKNTRRRRVRGRGRKKTFEQIIAENFQLDVKHQSIYPRGSANSNKQKIDEQKHIHTQAHLSQNVEKQNKENIVRTKEKCLITYKGT